MALNKQLFRRTDDQKNEARKSNNRKKTPYAYTQKKKLKQTQNKQIKIFVISRLTSTKQHQHKTLTN
jgi:hypothetical protein